MRKKTTTIGNEVFAVMSPKRARALEAVAQEAKRSICHCEACEVLNSPLRLALSRLARLSSPPRRPRRKP